MTTEGTLWPSEMPRSVRPPPRIVRLANDARSSHSSNTPRGRRSTFAPMSLWTLTDLITPMAVRVAATLRVADRIDAGTTEIEALAHEVGADAGALARLLRHLASHDVFAEPEPGVFALGPLGRPLLDDDPSATRGWLDLEGFGGRMDLAFFDLLETVRRGSPPERTGREDLDAKTGESYDTVMEAQSRAQAPGIVAAHDWSACEHVADVGGGTGTLLAEVLRTHAHLRGTLLELPGTAEAGRRLLAQEGLADRAQVIAGSVFEVETPPADRYLLKFVLHAFGDAEAAEILRRCAAAASPGARVLVVEQTLTDGDDGSSNFTGMDMRMLILGRGRERTLAEYTALAEEAGLAFASVRRIPNGPHVIEYAK
jgi:precorrin-6B methylase 2